MYIYIHTCIYMYVYIYIFIYVFALEQKSLSKIDFFCSKDLTIEGAYLLFALHAHHRHLFCTTSHVIFQWTIVTPRRAKSYKNSYTVNSIPATHSVGAARKSKLNRQHSHAHTHKLTPWQMPFDAARNFSFRRAS